MIPELKPRPFPNRHFLFQLIDNPLTCPETFASVRTRHSEEKGCFTNRDKTDSVMNDNELKPKSLCGLFGNSFQLVLCHFTMRVVINSLNFAAILDWSD
jgi:hypothetical protein